jgi:cytochrome b561
MQYYEKYSLSLRVLHWVLALLTIGLIIIGFYMGGIDNANPNKMAVYSFHKSIGLSILLLVLLRITARFFSYTPELPSFIPKIHHVMAKVVQFLLYCMLIIMPISGLLLSNLAGYPVKFFDYDIPNIFIENKEYSSFFDKIHVIGAYVLITLISLHILGTISHIVKDKYKYNVLKRII